MTLDLESQPRQPIGQDMAPAHFRLCIIVVALGVGIVGASPAHHDHGRRGVAVGGHGAQVGGLYRR